ncbi:MAG TPA: HAD family hydrolase [Vicinamibacterales bacterium]|nr:HAD family hydrolase [Vicinamibacterales bacterium]HPW19218.1 HAD family hydrolase [Vicinamibacterales bacterium]
MAARTLALFDLDDTLLAGDSDYEWGLFLAEIGAIDEAGYKARNDEFMAQYRAGTLDLQAFLAFQLCPLSQFSMAQLDAWHAQFMERKILPIVRPGSRALLDKHRGAVQVMVTATNEFVTAPIAAAFGIPALIATALERADGRFTGRTVGTPSFREGKVVRLKEWLASRGERLEDYAESWFYSDSINDVPLMSLVTHPVAVHPDEPLRAHALERGWPIIRLD